MREQCWIMNVTTVEAPPATAPSKDALREAHHDFIRRLDDKGILIGAGSFRDENNERHGTGMIIFQADTRADAEAIANAEPYIKAGVRILKLTPWQRTAGR